MRAKEDGKKKQDGNTDFELGLTPDERAKFRDCCEYWFGVRKWPPLITLALVLGCVVTHYVAGEGSVPGNTAATMVYRPMGGENTWYRGLSAVFSHVHDEHLWMNMIMAIVVGGFFELTEGPLLTFGVYWGAGTLGFALHGVVRRAVLVRGASGAVYGVTFAQMSLLGLNWREMPLRWVRLILIAILLGVDISIFWFWRTPGISFSAHLGGALAGVCIALVGGRNVRLRKWEISMTWAGVLGYVALLVVGFVGEQIAASALACAVLPPLVAYALLLTYRASKLPCCIKDLSQEAVEEDKDADTSPEDAKKKPMVRV